MSGSNRIESLVHRRDETSLTIDNAQGVPVTLFANRDVPIEMDAVEQALAFVSLQETVEEIWSEERTGKTAAFWGDSAGKLRRVVLTPDFHRGSGIPVGTVAEAEGFVVPQAVGNDVCCGMRLLMTDVTRDEIARCLDALDGPLRDVFFRGQRDIPMSPRQREALLKEGLWGLYETRADNGSSGIWRYYDARRQEAELARVHFQGVLPATGVFAFGDYVGVPARPTGAIRRSDRWAAAITSSSSRSSRRFSMERPPARGPSPGTGSPSWRTPGRSVWAMPWAGTSSIGPREIFPREMKRPAHGFYSSRPEGLTPRWLRRYLDAMHNAANFAFANRLFLGLMAVAVLSAAPVAGSSRIWSTTHLTTWCGRRSGLETLPPPQGRLSGTRCRTSALPARSGSRGSR